MDIKKMCNVHVERPAINCDKIARRLKRTNEGIWKLVVVLTLCATAFCAADGKLCTREPLSSRFVSLWQTSGTSSTNRPLEWLWWTGSDPFVSFGFLCFSDCLSVNFCENFPRSLLWILCEIHEWFVMENSGVFSVCLKKIFHEYWRESITIFILKR